MGRIEAGRKVSRQERNVDAYLKLFKLVVVARAPLQRPQFIKLDTV